MTEEMTTDTEVVSAALRGALRYFKMIKRNERYLIEAFQRARMPSNSFVVPIDINIQRIQNALEHLKGICNELKETEKEEEEEGCLPS